MLMNELHHGGLLLHGLTFVLGNDLEEIGSVAKSPVNQGREICVWPNSSLPMELQKQLHEHCQDHRQFHPQLFSLSYRVDL